MQLIYRMVWFVALFLLINPATVFALAFPNAVGFGRNATGGRGGQIIKVTSLADSGAGTFRAALETSGARIIVFDVAGTITLNSSLRVPIDNGNVTIAAQTSPGGIQLRRGGLTIQGSNVIVRGLVSRPGDDAGGVAPDNRDALQIENHTGTGVGTVIVDHCTFMWSTDELATTWHPAASDITYSHNIFSEALHDSIHPSGPHSMGPLLGTGTTRVTMYANLISNNNERNPQTYADQLEFINNVQQNVRNLSLRIRNTGGAKRTNIINNVFYRGPSWTGVRTPVMILDADNVAGTAVYLVGNNITTYPNLVNASQYIVANPAFAGTGITAMPVNSVLNYVASNVGARPWNRDAQEARIVGQLSSNTGAIINATASVGGWPTLAGSPHADTDGDGIPDWWEDEYGLDKNNANDAHLDRNGDGWSNIEEYINHFYIGLPDPSPGDPGGGEPDVPYDPGVHPESPSRLRTADQGQPIRVGAGRELR